MVSIRIVLEGQRLWISERSGKKERASAYPVLEVLHHL